MIVPIAIHIPLPVPISILNLIPKGIGMKNEE